MITNRILLGDCLDVIPALPAQSIDMVLADLPYGTTYAGWDKLVPMDRLWPELLRVTKPGAAIVFTAAQPFSSLLVTSRPDLYRTEWIWDKEHAANFANANRQPMKVHEKILVFATKQPHYDPQKTLGAANHAQGQRGRSRTAGTQRIDPSSAPDDFSGMKFPKSIQRFSWHSSQKSTNHSTEKPVALFEYLIRTYSRPNDIVLDPCIGSGTTAIAAMTTERRWIGVESDPTCHATAVNRVLYRAVDDLTEVISDGRSDA